LDAPGSTRLSVLGHGPGQAAAESAIAELRAKWQEAKRPADFSTGRLGLLATEYE